MTRSLSDETLIESVELYRLHGSARKAADAINLDRRAFDRRLQQAALRGLMGYNPVLKGFEVKDTSTQFGADGEVQKQWVRQRQEAGAPFELPAGHAIKGVSALVGPDDRVLAKWVKTRSDAIDSAAIVADLQAHFAKFAPSAPASPVPALAFEDTLAFYPWADPHFGLLAWAKETGENWDLKISVRAVREIFRKVVDRVPPSRQALLLVGGDTLHADNNENRTPRSGNSLQVDGRHPKVFLTACETIVENINLLLAKHERVEVIVLPGNHDETSAAPIAFFLYAWFRNEPRVTVDTKPAVFRFRQFGQVMLTMTHGHTVKIKDMPSVAAAREPKIWGATTHRFVHGFHVHHRSEWVSEGAGAIAETHQIVAPSDAWHYGQGYTAGRSMKAIIYDRDCGEALRITVPVVGLWNQ